MAVEVYPANILSGASGGLGLATSFSDDFNRVALGPNWLITTYMRLPLGSPYAGTIYDDTGTVLRSQGIAINNPVATWLATMQALPCRIATFQKTQFVQATIASQAGPAAANNCGLQLMIQTDDPITMTGYVLNLNTAGGTIQIQRVIDNGFTGLGANIAYAVGDVIRLSADVDTPGQVTLRFTKNAVVVDTFVDNTGLRLTNGFTGGFWGAQAQTGGVSAVTTWDNFSCGLGL